MLLSWLNTLELTLKPFLLLQWLGVALPGPDDFKYKIFFFLPASYRG